MIVRPQLTYNVVAIGLSGQQSQTQSLANYQILHTYVFREQ